MQKYPNQIVGNIGLFYACDKLPTLDWNAIPTSRNARGVDVICFSMDGHRILTIQVKTLSTRNPVPLGADLKNIMGDFWVIVTNARSDSPDSYILLPHEVKALAGTGEKDGSVSYWLGPKRYRHPEFQENWGRIGCGF